MKGIIYDKNRQKWFARGTFNGKRQFIGRFNTESEAIEAYLRVTAFHKYELAYEPTEDSAWKQAYRKIKVMLFRKQLEKQLDRHIADQIEERL